MTSEDDDPRLPIGVHHTERKVQGVSGFIIITTHYPERSTWKCGPFAGDPCYKHTYLERTEIEIISTGGTPGPVGGGDGRPDGHGEGRSGGGNGSGMSTGNSDSATAERDKEEQARKARCQVYFNAIEKAHSTYWKTRADIQELTGQSKLASISRVIADTGAVTEGVLEAAANYNLPVLQGVPKNILGYMNFAGKVYAGGATVLDLFNAGAEYHANGWTGDVTYNIGSAGVNAFALYAGNRWSKGFTRHPAVGIGVGAGALGIGIYTSMSDYHNKRSELESLLSHLQRNEYNFQLAQQKYKEWNCKDFVSE